MQGPELGSRPGRPRAAAGREILQRADWRQNDRQAHILAQDLGARVDVLDIAQHTRTERDGVERAPVALQRRLGLGAAHQIVPASPGQFTPRWLDELVQDSVLQVFVHSSPPCARHVARHVACARTRMKHTRAGW